MRLDLYLTTHHLAESREKAKYLIRQGLVLLNQQAVTKPSKEVRDTDQVELQDEFQYVGRGGYKLAAAQNAFHLDFKNTIVVDVGCSTGGFTDFALQQGALKVHAIDTGDPLDGRLKQDPRVHYLPLTDARTLGDLGDRANLVLIDVTFVTVPEILARSKEWVTQAGKIVALIKPPFERPGKAKKVKDLGECRRIVDDIIAWAIQNGFDFMGCIESPLLGKSAGQREFFICITVKEG